MQSSGLSRRKVKEYLHSSSTYTRYRTAAEKFPRLKTKTLGINHIWSLDIAYMDKLAKQNNGMKYLLIAVDILSRFTRVAPMRGKTAPHTKKAFETMLGETMAQKPVKCWVDEGGEFEGEFKRFCEANGIHIYHTFTETKSSFAERYIRTLKSIVYKYMAANETDRYIIQLPSIVKLMNSRVNRMIGMAPEDVTSGHTDYLLMLQERPPKVNRRPKFRVGQTVRVAFKKDVFDKGYKQSFSNEVYKVIRVSKQNQPITYVLQDIEKRSILRRFYEKQLVLYRYYDSHNRARHQRII